MKFLCAGCERLVELVEPQVIGNQLVVRCEKCGRSETVSLRASAPSAATPTTTIPAAAPETALGYLSVPEGFCPKCVAVRPAGALQCPSCGLTYDNFDAASVEPSEPLKRLWADVCAHWEDEARHDALLAEASAQGELIAVGRLYRIRLARSPNDAMAQRGRDEVLRLASAASLEAISREGPRKSPVKYVVALGFLALFAGLVYLAAQAFAAFRP